MLPERGVLSAALRGGGAGAEVEVPRVEVTASTLSGSGEHRQQEGAERLPHLKHGWSLQAAHRE